MIRKIILLTSIATIFSSYLSAGTINSAKIEYVQVNNIAGSSNVVVIKFDTPPTSPSCADDRMIASLDTSGGKALLSIALTAHASGKSVSVQGAGQCDGNLEVVSYMRVL